IRHAQRRTFTLFDFLPAGVTHEDCFASHETSLGGHYTGDCSEYTRWNLRGAPSSVHSRRSKQAEKRLFLQLEPDFAGREDAEMSRPEILERSPVEILVDHSGRYVRGAAYRRGVSESLAHAPHRVRHGAALGRGSLHRPALRECDRRRQRASPGVEV